MKIKSKNESAVTAGGGKQKRSLGKTGLAILALFATFFISLGVSSGASSPPTRLSGINQISEAYAAVESVGGTYYGPVTNMAYTGAGEFHYLSGGIYEGEFLDSKREGEGKYSWDDGDVFEGTWADDQMISGTYIWANGDVFDGTWSGNALDSGTYTFADGTSYAGSFNRGMFGSGTLELSNDLEESGFNSYTATFENGTITEVAFSSADGTTYSGDITGTAVIGYSNGDNYSGSVKNGLRNGQGTYIWKDGSGNTLASYNGNWSNGVMEGKGTYYYSNTTYPNLVGTFVNGKPDGTAVYYKEAGNTFDTVWSNGKCTKVTET